MMTDLTEWTGVSPAEQLWWASTASFLLAFAAMWAVSLVDLRVLDGASVWAKPMKFAAATVLHFATLALVVRFLSGAMQDSKILSFLALASVIAAIGEVGYIAFQAARMQASHFNVDTPFHAAMYSIMAFGAVVLVVASGAVGVAAAIDTDASFSAPVRLAIAVGLIGGTALTLITAFRLGGNMSHHVGAEVATALRMPITGWSLTVGDLRPPHFFATHMMQAIPLFGVIAARLLPSGLALAAVLLAAVVWTAVTLILFTIALSGRPFTAFISQ
ncbi:MAG: hypothetical protein ACKVOJ_02305 [Sphingomonadaceae bacterium]